jgi:hypothetical protein
VIEIDKQAGEQPANNDETETLLPNGEVRKPVTTEVAVYLKDQPFVTQLTSGIYLRLTTFFLIASWWANFYIATVTTELGDQGWFSAEAQHMLARWWSFIDAGAIVCAPFSGFMLDSVGFVPTAVLTIGFGCAQMILLLVATDRMTIMLASFVAYACFRAFLFPYYFASLSKKIEFSFFGMLSGISFGISGLSQFTIAPLATLVEGTCHEEEVQEEFLEEAGSTCSEGSWYLMHWIQLGNLVLLGLIPWYEYYSSYSESKAAILTNKHKMLEDTAHTTTMSYDSISS